MKKYSSYPFQQGFKRFIKPVGLLLLNLVLLLGCEKDIKELEKLSNDKGSLNEQDVTKLFKYGQHASTNKVIIFVQGGPASTLDMDDFGPSHRKHLLDFTIVYAHQSQTLNPNIVNSDLSVEENILEYKKSVKILNEIVNYFKSQKKYVVLIGHSYGGFLIQHYLHLYENKADKCIIMGARLDMPQEVWEGAKKGEYYRFKDRGMTPYRVNESSDEEEKSEKYKEELKEFIGIAKLGGATFQYRFTELLKNKDLRNVIYITAEEDEACGRLSLGEIAFLTKKGVKHRMFTTKDANNAWHDCMLRITSNFEEVVTILRAN